jgi:hypothetical protein
MLTLIFHGHEVARAHDSFEILAEGGEVDHRLNSALCELSVCDRTSEIEARCLAGASGGQVGLGIAKVAFPIDRLIRVSRRTMWIVE